MENIEKVLAFLDETQTYGDSIKEYILQYLFLLKKAAFIKIEKL